MEKKAVKKLSDAPLARSKASLQDILGAAPKPRRVDAQWAGQYQALVKLREQFSKESQTLAEEAREDAPNFSEHMADAGTDSYDRDWALAMLSSDQNVIFEIDQALARIHNGSYGQCELTGQPIEPERLQAIPWTRFSTEAQKELEATGGANRAQLGELRDHTTQASELSDSEEESGENGPKERSD
jgi:DnaK suppressor protein